MAKTSSPPTHKLLARCHSFPGCPALFRLISFASLPSCGLWCLDSKSWGLVPHYRCSSLSLPWKGDLCSGCCHWECCPIGSDSWLPTQAPVCLQSWSHLKGGHFNHYCIYRMLLYAPVNKTHFHTNEHEWAWSQYFSVWDYSCSYFLAFLLL